MKDKSTGQAKMPQSVQTHDYPKVKTGMNTGYVDTQPGLDKRASENNRKLNAGANKKNY